MGLYIAPISIIDLVLSQQGLDRLVEHSAAGLTGSLAKRLDGRQRLGRQADRDLRRSIHTQFMPQV